jgi:hypothetical protein
VELVALLQVLQQQLQSIQTQLLQPVPEVQPSAKITPHSFSGCYGGNLAYQWQKGGVNLTNGGTISGVNTANLAITNAFLADAGIYSCNVTGACGSIHHHQQLHLLLNPLTKINTQPLSATRCVGESVIFTINASGSALTYQWRKNGTNISSATSSSYSINSLILNDGASYTCLVTGSCGSILSNPAVLTVNNPAAISTQPSSVTICQGTSTSLSVIAVGTNLTYKWYKNTVEMSDGGHYNGTSSNTLIISNADLTDGGSFTCLVSGTCNNVTSQPAVVTISPITVITQNPSDMTKCNGDNAFFEIKASGVNLTYQWQFNNVNIPGATQDYLILGSISSASQGTYHCVATSSTVARQQVSGNLNGYSKRPVHRSTGRFANL